LPRGTRLRVAAAALAKQLGATGPPRPPPATRSRGRRSGALPRKAITELRLERRRAAYERVRALHATGMNVAAIAHAVGVSRMTVYAYLRQGPPQPQRHAHRRRPRVLDPYEPYLLQRWQDGCRVANQLYREIRARGYA